MYGLTEAFRSTYLDPSLVDAFPDAIGQAIPGADVRVVDDAGRECVSDVVGELVHRGPTVALGYWRDPESTASVFRPTPPCFGAVGSADRTVYSGDLARRNAAGLLTWVGRRDGMIKSLGFRISPDEVVDALHASEQIAEALVVAEPDESRGSRLVAVVVLKPGGSLDALKRFARAELPRYMLPDRFDVRATLPRTTSGKYDNTAAGRDTVPE